MSVNEGNRMMLEIPTVTAWRFGLFCLPLAAFQRDRDLPEVWCPLPISANVLDILQCLKKCKIFLCWQLICCRTPVFLELWGPALSLSFVLPSKQWHRESSIVKRREIFPLYLSPLLCGNQDPSETFQVDSIWHQPCMGIASLQSMEQFHWVTYSAG